MTNEELLRQLYDDTLVGNGPSVLELTTVVWYLDWSRRDHAT